MRWSVTTPSMMTFGVPFRITTMTTRRISIDEPPDSRNRVCSGERLLTEKLSSKPLRPTSLVVTVTSVSASTTTRGAGTGTSGLTYSCTFTPLSTAASREAGRQRDAQRAAGDLGQRVGAQRAVGIAQAPELFGVADVER